MRGSLTNISTGEAFELEETSSIGRSRDSVVAIADPRVSRRHALIRRQEDGFWLFDLGSINGSYLNGRRLTTASVLKEGDEIRIGTHVFRFEGSGPTSVDFDLPATDVTIIDVQSKRVLLLVSDIEGFTALSEKLAPDQLGPIIGSWYDHTQRILDAHEATVDKYIGDCVLAYWLETSPATRSKALNAARAMQEACDNVQREHAAILEEAELSFKSGTAIHLGPAAYGSFSANEFTLLGDAVNLVFRLEGLTRELHEPILLSGDVLNGWEEGRAMCRALGSQAVKGRVQEVEIFAPNAVA